MKAFADLYAQLATAEDEPSAKKFASQIERLWSHTGSDTIDLGNASNSLDDLNGTICVEGDAHLTLPRNKQSVSCLGTTISRTLEVGDVLTVHDEGDASANTYTVTDTSVSRGALKINYSTIETLNVNAGTGTDTINVTTTAASVNTNITTTAGGDTVSVTTSNYDAEFGRAAGAVSAAAPGTRSNSRRSRPGR